MSSVLLVFKLLLLREGDGIYLNTLVNLFHFSVFLKATGSGCLKIQLCSPHILRTFLFLAMACLRRALKQLFGGKMWPKPTSSKAIGQFYSFQAQCTIGPSGHPLHWIVPQRSRLIFLSLFTIKGIGGTMRTWGPWTLDIQNLLLCGKASQTLHREPLWTKPMVRHWNDPS